MFFKEKTNFPDFASVRTKTLEYINYVLSPSNKNGSIPIKVRWFPTPEGIYKLNIDGSFPKANAR